jgi:hypothetical protein
MKKILLLLLLTFSAKLMAQLTPGQPHNLYECPTIAGQACFTLSTNTSIILNGLPTNQYTVTYHVTLEGANNNSNSIAPTTCASSPLVIYARLTNIETQEYAVTSFTITPANLLIDTSTSWSTMSACDLDGDLMTEFNLTTAASTGTLYSSEADAINMVNPITNLAAYPVSVSTPTVYIYHRSVSGSANTCASIKRITLNSFAQCSESYTCSDARSLCGSLGAPFTNTHGGFIAQQGQYNCLVTTPNPTWFYIPVSTSGQIHYNISQNSEIDFSGTGLDVDFICYGPFDNLETACQNFSNNNVVGCSYSAMFSEQLTIPNAIAGKYYLLMVTNFSDDPGYIKIQPIGNSSPGDAILGCSGFILNAFIDENSNGIKDNNESGFPMGNFTYQINSNGNIHNISDADGSYVIYEDDITNSYDIQFTIIPEYSPYYSVTTPFYSNVNVQLGNIPTVYNFPVTIVQLYQDLAVNLIANSAPRPGFTYQNTISYTNTGNQLIATGTVSFTKDPLVTISNISQTGTIATANGFDYTFSNLQPFETRTITVTMNVPTIPQVALGQLLETTASIMPVAGDINPSNNTSSSIQSIIGSYDPNDKMESRGERILISEFGNNDYLYYTIRFQNTGTAAAEIVRIQDILDNQLDESTVEMIRASHNYSLDRVNNTLTWTFNNINLPHSGANEPASHGYVYFRVKPVAGFQVGDVIPNTASIYFDFNPAIVTNTVNSEFVAAMGIEDITASAFTMYPNPADKTVNLQLGHMADTIQSVRVYDVTGKTLYFNSNLSATSTFIDVTQFGTGAYFVELVTGSNIKAVKKLLVK